MMNWNLSNTLSIIGITASIENIFIVVYICKKQSTQKQREMIANDVEVLIKKIEYFGKDILDSCNKYIINIFLLVKYDLEIIKGIDKNQNMKII